MKTHILALLALVLANGCATVQDPRLSGTFQSDRVATIEYLRSTGSYTPEKLEKLKGIFGKLKVSYTRAYVLSDFDGHKDKQRFRIVETGDDYAIVETTTPFMDEPVRYRLAFTDDGYWLSEGPLKEGFKEKFTRIANQSSEAIAPQGGSQPQR